MNEEGSCRHSAHDDIRAFEGMPQRRPASPRITSSPHARTTTAPAACEDAHFQLDRHSVLRGRRGRHAAQPDSGPLVHGRGVIARMSADLDVNRGLTPTARRVRRRDFDDDCHRTVRSWSPLCSQMLCTSAHTVPMVRSKATRATDPSCNAHAYTRPVSAMKDRSLFAPGMMRSERKLEAMGKKNNRTPRSPPTMRDAGERIAHQRQLVAWCFVVPMESEEVRRNNGKSLLYRVASQTVSTSSGRMCR